MSSRRSHLGLGVFAAVAAACLTVGVAAPAGAATPASSSSAAGHRVGGIIAPNVALVVNETGQPLVVTKVDLGQGAVPATFDGPGPYVGEIVPAEGSLMVNWVEWFFGSNADVTFQTEDGSGTVRTRTGMNMLTGWGYGCDNAAGSLACVDGGTNPPSWSGNVAVTGS